MSTKGARAPVSVSFRVQGAPDSKLHHKVSFQCFNAQMPLSKAALLELAMRATAELHAQRRLSETEEFHSHMQELCRVVESVAGSRVGSLNTPRDPESSRLVPLAASVCVRGATQCHVGVFGTASFTAGKLQLLHEGHCFDTAIPALELNLHTNGSQAPTQALLVASPVESGKIWLRSFITKNVKSRPRTLVNNPCVVRGVPATCSHRDKRALLRQAHVSVLQNTLNGLVGFDADISHDEVSEFNIATTQLPDHAASSQDHACLVSIMQFV